MSISPQSCTNIPTEGAPLTHGMCACYNLHGLIGFDYCAVLQPSAAGMVIGRSLTMPHVESSKTVEEPPNESHEEYLPPQQPPADKPCDNEEPEAPVKNRQWSDPPGQFSHPSSHYPCELDKQPCEYEKPKVPVKNYQWSDPPGSADTGSPSRGTFTSFREGQFSYLCLITS